MQTYVENKSRFPLWASSFPLWAKILCTLGLLYGGFLFDLFLLFFLFLADDALASFGCVLAALIPLLLLLLIWVPKKKPAVLAVGGFSVGVMFVSWVCILSFFVTSFRMEKFRDAIYRERIDTAPAIDVNRYLPFDEDSEIVKLRSTALEFQKDPPVIDGAAALFPVYSAFVNATYPRDTVLTDDGVFQYNNTPEGYKALAEKRTDLFIGVYPSEEQIAYAEENGTHFVYTPIGYDAFVFFVHRDNPIESLTTEEIQAIYAGEVTNWNALGGKDEPIVAYQRNAGSGSQSMLLRFMGDKEPMDAPKTSVSYSMGGIIHEVADYRNATTSIGFSFRFYVEGIIQNPDIKMIAIDGILPTAENVRNGSYPIRTPFYAVTYTENQNPNTGRLMQWILSEEGQYIIEETGYIGV